MLYTRNAFSFRKFYKEKVAREQGRLDLNFVGSLHPDKSRRETGFSKLIYGNREDLGKLLGTIALNVAADDQAIYELIQNADDCKSSFFSVSYNEEYLLCINNGNYFSNQDMSAIINVAGNYKEGEDIGTFGIGFKILHRLVGKDDGREAIINDYAGPIIFSWNKFYQLKSFLEGDEIRIGYDSERDNENAWLIKLLYTCFPTHLGEKIRLQDYDTQDVKFTDSELSEMRECLKSSLQNVNLTETNYLKNGSIFFLKLGEGKSKFLDDGIDKIKSGLSYSFKFLNRLEKIYINEEEIKAQRVMDYSQSFPIDSQEFNTINPKNKKRDIKFTFAYYRDYRKAENLRNEVVPNLYTFFSMDEEKNGFNFLLHCNAFDMNNDRRKLQANSQINEKLLPAIASNIIQYIDNQKVNKNLFVSLYANLLLSKEPKNKPHINNSFFQYFKKYILENIPTSNSYSDNPQNVKIKNTLLEIYPSDFGCSEIDWFYWNDEKYDSILINEARNSEKLNLKEWNIIDLLEYAIEKGKINYVDDWIRNAQPKIYFLFLKEIERHITKTALTMVAQIRLFKFSDENFYSLKDIFSSNDLILNYDKTSDIRFEMQAIGFKSSYVNIAEYPNIKELIENKLDDLVIFQQIADRVKDNQLRKDQKHKLLLALQEFNGVGIEKLKNLELFKDTKGNIRPLRNLLKGDIQVPNWLFPFKIHIAEYIPELDQYLIDEAAIYKELIYQNWDEIIANARDEKEFYAKIIYYFGLNTDNPSLKRDTHNYIYTKDGFKTFNQIFFNSKMKELGSQYVNFQNAVTAILGYPTPQKSVLHFLEQSPFYVQNGDFCEQNINTVCLEILEINEIKAAIYFCQLNGEHFFENLIVEKIEGQFFVSAKTEDVYQVKPSNKEVIDFILENLSDNFKILPPELDAYKDESGIIQKEELYELILHNVEIDDYKEELIDIIAYDEPKCKLLFGLSEIRFITAKRYSKESFEYKVLDKAIQNLNITDYDNFKEKFVFENEGSDLSLSDIPPCADKIKIDDIELSLSEILPDSYQNSNILSALIDKFVKLGLPKDKLDALF
ncbi:MAG: hypothetical protein LBC68_01920, partial [Prevotellaceae bacterium]|nr:hypothetical protein [Prevotellaceae bacterium]